MYKIDNRSKKHKGRYTILGIVLGISLTLAGVYLYDNNKQPILDNVNQVKEFAIKQIPKDSPVIQVVNDKPVGKINTETQLVDNSQQNTQQSNTSVQSIDIYSLEQQIHDHINTIRIQNGQKTLVYNEQISNMARDHSKDMALNNYFDHTSLDGKTFQDRVFASRIACYPAGENIEINYQSEPNLLDSIMQTWLDSPEHKQNILSPFYTSEGIGVYVSGDNVLVTDDFC